MTSLHCFKLKVKVNKAGGIYVHVKPLGGTACPHCHKNMIICGSKKRWYKVYLNRNHTDNAFDILELNLAVEPGLDWYPDPDDVTYERILFTIPVFLCRYCKDRPNHYHRGIVEDMMQTRLWNTIKTMCDMACRDDMPPDISSDDHDIYQTARMIRRIIMFAYDSHLSNRKSLKPPKKTDISGRREFIRVIRETISARMKKFYK